MSKQSERTIAPRSNTEENTTDNSELVELAIVENPMETDVEINETLDDLGPELAKMGRILAREITKSLSNALIPLQNDIIQLREDTAHLTKSENKVKELKLKVYMPECASLN